MWRAKKQEMIMSVWMIVFGDCGKKNATERETGMERQHGGVQEGLLNFP